MTWFSEAELMSNNHETYFIVDANLDNYLGSKEKKNSLGGYELSLNKQRCYCY